MKRIVSVLLSLILAVSTLSALTVYAVDADISNATEFVPGEEYVLVMNATKAYLDGVYVSASTPYCMLAESYKEGMALAKPPATADAAESSLWRISYGKTTGTVTLYSDYAKKFLNMTTSAATLSDTPQALNAVVTDTSIQIYVTENGTNYYLRFTRGTGANDSGRYIVAANKNTTTFTLRSVQDVKSDCFIAPMDQFVSGGEYILARGGTKDKAGITMEYSVVAAPKENGLQYAARPTNVAQAADSLWQISKNDDGTYVFYSKAAGKYLNLSAEAASLSDMPQNLSVDLAGRKMKIYTEVDGITYYLRFSNAMNTGSAWHSGNLTTSNEFTLYALRYPDAEYDNSEQQPLYSVACFADLHVDYGIQSWENPIRQGTVDAVNYLKNNLGGANAILVGGDIFSNNDKNAEWSNEILEKAQDTIYNTLLQGSTDSVVLPITGNHDTEPGQTAGGTVYSGDWESYLTENVGVFDACLRNTESTFKEVLCYRYSLNGIEFLNVNTPYSTSPATLYLNQAEWVADQLAEIGKNKTVILQCHYPLESTETGVAEAMALLRETLEKYPNVIYCYGHIHGSDSDYVWYSTSELVQTTGTATKNEDHSWNVNGTITCHMGSMGYYKTQFQPDRLSAEEPQIVQFLKMDFYEDHVTFRYYNTGEKSGDPNVYEIASYTVKRDFDNTVLGDADGNGSLDMADAVLLMQYLVGEDVSLDAAVADLDENGRISIYDAVVLLRKLSQ